MNAGSESESSVTPKFSLRKLQKYGFEFMLLFLAVFLGFFADGLRQENSERLKAYTLARDFYEELKNDSVTASSKREGRLKKEKAIEYMIAFLKDSSLQSSSKKLSINFLWATTIRTPIIFNPRTVVLEQLRSSGGMQYFNNPRLHQLVGDLSVAIAYLHERQVLEAAVYHDYIEPIMISHLDFDFQNKLFTNGIFDLLAKYESNDEYIPFRLSQPENIQRETYINIFSYYQTNNLKSTRIIPLADYITINAALLKELRKELELSH